MTDEGRTIGTETDIATLIERYHDLALRTQNPVYLWLALEQMLAPSAGLESAPPEAVTIPAWMCAYLHDAAARINMLAVGVDYRKDPPPIDPGLFVADGEPWDVADILRSSEMCANTAAIAIDPRKAMAAVPHALGFVEGTTNRFSELLAATSKMHEARFYDAATAAGVAAKVAVGAIAKGSDAKAQSERQIYERIQKGRDLL